MSGFTYSQKIELITTDGPKVSKALAGALGNGQEFVNDEFDNNDSINLTQKLANITLPCVLAIECSGQGVKVAWDTLAASTKVIRHMLIDYRPDATGAVVMILTAQGPRQRIKVLCLGEPV